MANLHILGFFGLGISFTAAVVAPLFAGCGSAVSSGNGGHGVGGHGVAGHGVAGHGVGGNGVGGNGTAVDCSALLANAETTPVAVRLVNHTAADVYFGSASGSCSDPAPAYEIQDPQGVFIPWQNPDNCGFTCKEFSCTATCTSTSTCPSHSVVRIAPGGTRELSWKGAVIESRTLPSACAIPKSCTDGAQCVAWVAPPAVPLTFVGTVWTGMQCQFGMCACTPDASGTCVAQNGETAGNPVQASATLSPGGTSVDIVFQ